MSLFLIFVFIFYTGSSIGWVIELIFRRIVHGKWVNPGFLIGPYLPIYGFGLSILTLTYLMFKDTGLHPIFIILLMGISMTIIELIGGFIGLMNNVKLWDYSDRWGNFKGIICPLFSLIWTLAGALYYFVLSSHVMNALDWYSENLTFSYTLGIFTGCIIIDFVYSCKLYIKIKEFAKNNKIVIKYEQFKLRIKEEQKKMNERYSFLNPFKQTKPLIDYLSTYINSKK